MTLVISIAAALALGTVLELLHVPAGVLIGAMVAIAALRLSGTDAPDMPALLRFGALLIIGCPACPGGRGIRLDGLGPRLGAVAHRRDGPGNGGACDLSWRHGADGGADIRDGSERAARGWISFVANRDRSVHGSNREPIRRQLAIG